MAEVVYETLTEDLKKELHLRAAKYLETSAIQCVNCGGFETTYVYGFMLKAPDMAPENEVRDYVWTHTLMVYLVLVLIDLSWS